jgi:hypothetical protein
LSARCPSIAGGPAGWPLSPPAPLPPAVSPPFPALPAPPSLPSSLLLSLVPSLLPSVPPPLLSFPTAAVPTPEGTEAGSGSSNRQRRSGTASPVGASAWPHRERLDPAAGTRSGEWGRGATMSPGPACSGTPPLPSRGQSGDWEESLGDKERDARWVAGAALRPLCPLGSANKATFRDQFRGIQRMRLSWRWG